MQMNVVSIAINKFLLLKNMVDGMEMATGLLELAHGLQHRCFPPGLMNKQGFTPDVAG